MVSMNLSRCGKMARYWYVLGHVQTWWALFRDNRKTSILSRRKLRVQGENAHPPFAATNLSNEGQACADPWARTPISASNILRYVARQTYWPILCISFGWCTFVVPKKISCYWLTRFMKIILLGLSLVRTILQYGCTETGLQYKRTAVQLIQA